MVEADDKYGKFEFRPLEPGFGITVGNALRRILLSSLKGYAINTVRIEGVEHEFASIPGVKEDVTNIILNLKQVRFKQVVEEFENEKVSVTVPGMDREVTLLWLSDLHIAADSEGMDPASKDDVAFRQQYSSYEAVKAAEQWAGKKQDYEWQSCWIQVLNRTEADAVIFGGDILDYNCPEGIELLRSGLSMLNKPYIDARADHDMLPTYQTDGDLQAAKDRQDSLCKDEGVMTMDFEDFYLIVWNDSTSDLTDSGLERIRTLAAEGRPMILVTHVPIEPLDDSSLAEASKAVYGGRSLLWGYNDAQYWPGENTRQLLDMIYADDSPFVEILCGHLHLSWEGMVSAHVHETVFSPAFERYMGVISCHGE